MSELPDQWQAVKLSDVCEINPGKPRDRTITSDTQVTFVPMAAVDAGSGQIVNPTTRLFTKVAKGFTAFQENDIIFAKITPCMENGKAAIARRLINGIGFGSTEFHVLRANGTVLPEFVFYFIRQDSFRETAEANMTGSVGQKRVPVNFLKDTIIPLPPLNEQRRIVAKLEKLLSRVDTAQARLAKIPIILKRFRQSVLAAACSGRLTADWREQHPDSGSQAARSIELANNDNCEIPAAWNPKTMGELLERIQAGNNFACIERPPTNKEIGVLKISAVTWGKYDENESKTCTDPSRVKPALFVQSGDFLFSRANTIELVGACVIVDDLTSKIMLSDKVLRFSFKNVDPRWVLYWLRSGSGRSQIEFLATGNQQSMRNIGQEKIKQIVIPVPQQEEQKEIVRRIEALFKTVGVLEARYLKTKGHVDDLIQSILARAFRGELVPQRSKRRSLIRIASTE